MNAVGGSGGDFGAGGGTGNSGGLTGGAGGFGGGGGGAVAIAAFGNTGGAGGFGAGGGGASTGGSGGTFGGAGGAGLGADGGGGAALGGAVFVRDGGSLTIADSPFSGSYTVTAGTTPGQGGATAGSAKGSVMFLHGTAATTVTVGTGNTQTIAGTDAISGDAGLTKSGAGTLVLSGTNSYTGATTVNAGTLRVTGSLDAASAVTVANGATLGGDGTIGGSVTSSLGGRLAPGNSIGTLSVGGNYTWNGSSDGSSTMLFELSNLDNSSDRLALTGALAKGAGSTFRFDFQGTGRPGVYTLATFGSTTFVTGDFSLTNLGVGLSATFSVSAGQLLLTVSATTSTLLTSSANPSVFGQPVTFTATVSAAAPSVGTPTGQVTFKDGATTLATVTLNGAGVATFTTASLSVAGHGMTAEYGGAVGILASTSPLLTQTVNGAATATNVVSSVNPSAFGQPVTFTATVTVSLPGAGTPTGTVTFKDGATTLATVTLAAGSATFTTSSLAAGGHPITAQYSGDSSFLTSTSSLLTQTVGAGATTTSIASSLNPSALGQQVTFTATVTGSPGTPTGTVTFKDGASTLGTVALAGGTATFATTSLTAGSHGITAEYGGDATFAASTSSVLGQVVSQPSLSIGSVSVVEGHLGTTPATFPVTLSVAPVAPVTVSYATSDGTAVAGAAGDYQSASGTITFAAGETSKTVSVLVNGDVVLEPAETFTLTLSSPVNASLGTSSAVGTITNDEGVTARDVDGDGKSDLLWLSGVDPFLWLMNGTAVKQAGYLSPVSTDWRVAGLGDFDGDGKADILWRAQSGATYVWQMNGLSVPARGYTAASADNNWQLQGVADFDGDGRADILWRKAGEGSDTGQLFLWLMNGTALKSAAYVTAPAGVDVSMSDTNWQVQGLSDFDGDGKADVLWRHASGRTQLWLMNGQLGLAGSGDTAAQTDATWRFQGAGDLNGDGKADILWRSAATGEAYLWLQNGRLLSGAGSLGTLTSEWRVDRLGDYNGDGRADILWRSNGGATYLWLMNGLQAIAGTGPTNAQADNGWQTQEPPRLP
jgi:autotransporter-associated beta strand protein